MVNSDHLQVWELDLDADWQRWLHLLSPDECARARRYASVDVARRFCAGRAALRLLLGHRCNVDPGILVLGVETYGKPMLRFPRHEDLYFQYLHSGPLAMMAIASARSG